MGELHAGRVRGGALEFGFLEARPGAERAPLALCLHGFPDTAWTWRHLLPRLAAHGYRAVAPFLRGYAPTEEPADGDYSAGALVADVGALHDALGGGPDAVLVGHDWGAVVGYGAAALAPERWRRLVTLAVPPMAAAAETMFTYDQLRRQWYVFFVQLPIADGVFAAEDLALVGELWRHWSPGYDASEDLVHVRAALGAPGRLAAALAYYRAYFAPPAPGHEAEQAALVAPTVQPTLYLHGSEDPCSSPVGPERALPLLGPGSRVQTLEGAGHFLHLERPDEIAALVTEFLGPPTVSG